MSLTDYELLCEEPSEGIDWCQIAGGDTNDPRKLDPDWLRRRVRQMTRRIKETPPPRYAGRLGDAALNMLGAARSLTASARRILLGVVSEEYTRFVTACIGRQVRLPATCCAGEADHGGPYRHGHEEPCGEVVSPCNFGPEWIRHFLGVLYDERSFTEATETGRHGFFPFKNRDHLIHSLVVVLMGEVLLGEEIDPDARNAVEAALPPTDGGIAEVSTIGGLIAEIYRIRHPEFFTSGPPADRWLRQVWPAVALWHDAGYDAATWCLLTFREFSHSAAVRSLMQDPRPGARVFDELRALLAGGVDREVEDVLGLLPGIPDGYHHLWHLEECSTQCRNRRPWGRYHALFSAFEFADLMRRQPEYAGREAQSNHLAAAIAHHHEPLPPDDIDQEEAGDEYLARLLIENPIRHLLSFADAMSSFGRIKVKEETVGGGTTPANPNKIRGRFEIDCDLAPVWILPPDGDQRRRFYKGPTVPRDFRGTEVKIRALWGDLLGDVPKDTAPQQCPRRTSGRCALYGPL